MNVVATPVGLDQQIILGKMGEQPQLDLRIISRQQNMSGFRSESCTNLAPQFGANGYVLQVRIGRRQPSRRGSGLSERSMETPARPAQQLRQRVNVSGFQLCELPVIQHHSRD